MPDEKAPLLRTQALNSAWRIRNARDAIEAGMLQSADDFIAARNRLAIRLGGQQSAQTVLEGLLESSLFVEESRRRLRSRSIRANMPWDGETPPDYRLIEYDLDECVHLINPVVEDVYTILNEWVDVFLNHHSVFVAPAQTDTTNTRFNQLVYLAREPLPEEPMDRLKWLYQVVTSATTPAQLDEVTPSILKGGNFPRGNYLAGWPAGLVTWSSLKTTEVQVLKQQAAALASDAGQRLQDRIHDPADGRLVFMSQVAYCLNPSRPFLHRDPNERYDRELLGLEIGREPPQMKMRVRETCRSKSSTICRTLWMPDLLRHLKSQEEAHDFDDVQLMVGDLLLVRCPAIVRHWYLPRRFRLWTILGTNHGQMNTYEEH